MRRHRWRILTLVIVLVARIICCNVASAQRVSPNQLAALVQQLRASDPEARRQAAWELGQCGEEARLTVPDLLAALDDPESRVRGAITVVLGNIGGYVDRCLPALTRLLTDSDGDVRFEAALALRSMGDGGWPLLAQAARSPDPMLRRGAVHALGLMSGQVRSRLSLLRTALEDRESSVRGEAVAGLERMGKAAHSAVPRLLRCLHDEDMGVRLSAAEAVGSMRADPRKAVPELARALHDPYPLVRSAAISSMKGMGSLGVRPLAQMLDSGDEIERQEAAKSLGQIGPAAKQAIPALLTTLQHSDPLTRYASEKALLRIVLNAQEEAPAFLLLLDSPSASIRATAASALGIMRANSPDVIRQLTLRLQDTHEGARGSALWALGQMGPSGYPAVMWALDAAHLPLRRVAVSICEELPEGADRLIPALIGALQDADPDVRASVFRSLARQKRRARAAFPKCVLALNDPYIVVRSGAATALGMIGGDPEVTVTALLHALEDTADEVVHAAGEALRRVGNERIRRRPPLSPKEHRRWMARLEQALPLLERRGAAAWIAAYRQSLAQFRARKRDRSLEASEGTLFPRKPEYVEGPIE